MKKVYSRIESITGNVITVRAEDIQYGELAEVSTRFGTSLAEVNKLTEGIVSLQVFAGGAWNFHGRRGPIPGASYAGVVYGLPHGPYL